MAFATIDPNSSSRNTLKALLAPRRVTRTVQVNMMSVGYPRLKNAHLPGRRTLFRSCGPESFFIPMNLVASTTIATTLQIRINTNKLALGAGGIFSTGRELGGSREEARSAMVEALKAQRSKR